MKSRAWRSGRMWRTGRFVPVVYQGGYMVSVAHGYGHRLDHTGAPHRVWYETGYVREACGRMKRLVYVPLAPDARCVCGYLGVDHEVWG